MDFVPGDPNDPEDEYRRGLHESLTRLGMVSDWLCVDVSPRGAVASSPAAKVLAEDPRVRVEGLYPTPLSDALQNLQMALVSAHDHIYSLGLSLCAPRTVGNSLYTLVRGALEAYGRVHYLMGDLTVQGILTQHIASRRSTLDKTIKEPKDKNGKSYSTPLSKQSAQYMSDIKRLAATWNISWGTVKPKGYRDIVGDVVRTYAGAKNLTIDTDVYGILSDVAHAENVGFRFFARMTGQVAQHGRGSFDFRLDYSYLTYLVDILVGVHVEVMKRYLEFCGATCDECEQWEEQVEYCQSTIGTILLALEEQRSQSQARADGGSE
jgi:hypothetical protein